MVKTKDWLRRHAEEAQAQARVKAEERHKVLMDKTTRLRSASKHTFEVIKNFSSELKDKMTIEKQDIVPVNPLDAFVEILEADLEKTKGD